MARSTTTRPGRGAQNFADAYATVSGDLMAKIGDSMASEAGAPAAVPVVPLTDPQRVRAWNQRHPAATDRARMDLAVAQYQAHRAAGLPDDEARRATAEDVTHFTYRARQPLYTLGTTSWKEQVSESNRIARMAKRDAPEPAPEAPEQAPATPETPDAMPPTGAAPAMPEQAAAPQAPLGPPMGGPDVVQS